MKAIKSRFLLALTSVAMVICLCIGITACKKDKGGDKETFPAPSNVVIVGDMLRWDAVDGAAEYTVKINANETASASTNSLDLTAVTSKLVSGENTLCVRVNATDDKNESAYSQAVTYTYSPVTQLATPAGLAVNGTTLSWNAVTGATNGYTVKIGAQTLSVNATELDLTSDEAKAVLVRGENSICVKANATSTLTESAYSDPVIYDYSITPAEEAAEFRTAVEAIGDVTSDSEAAIAQARAKYDVLSAEAKQVEGVDRVI
ncbi:MAG: hypothetical protein K2K28_00935, partial [Clostridia bacterium]|nr:hypothetical protein [Clostridia bacterium]